MRPVNILESQDRPLTIQEVCEMARYPYPYTTDQMQQFSRFCEQWNIRLVVNLSPLTLEEKRLHDAATVPGFDPSRDGALAPEREKV